jgi:hypothetical protein
MIDQNLIEKAKWAALIEQYHSDTDPRKLGEVSFAYLDILEDVLTTSSIIPQEYSESIDPILTRVYSYLESQ